jgi:DNA-binding GntR family transcriptional regulator
MMRLVNRTTLPETPAPPRKRGELQDRVSAELRRGLMVGKFVPGQIITLRTLARDLGTSAMPVREAINQLVASNALEMLPNRSVMVPRMTQERFMELTRVRQALEGMAAEVAARNCTPQLVKQLDKINRELLEKIRGRKDILGCLAKNQEFHFTLYAASKSEVLLPLIESLWLQAGPIMYFSLTSPEVLWDASSHAEALTALREKNPAAVKKVIERDISNTAKYLLKCSVFQNNAGPMAGLSL